MKILLEHNEEPGTVYDECLMFGSSVCSLNEMVNLNESTDSNTKNVKFRGKFQEAEAVNKNKRSYPYDILNTNVKRLEEVVKGNGLVGELDHPNDTIIHFKEASHKITKLWWEDKVLMGEGIILNTPHGRVLRSLINDGVRIGISSRGVGNGKVNENGILVIGESFRLVTFDCVADPSTHEAFQQKVVGKHESYIPSDEIISTVRKIDNESIDKHVRKEVLLACLGGIVNQKTKELKARLR